MIRQIFRRFGIYFEDEVGLLQDLHVAIYVFSTQQTKANYEIVLNRKKEYDLFIRKTHERAS